MNEDNKANKEWMILNGKAGWSRGCMYHRLEGCLIEELNTENCDILADSMDP